LHLCYWLYKGPNETYRVELSYWVTTHETTAGGLGIAPQILVWIKKPSPTDESWDTECSMHLPDTELALIHLAAGVDPLRESFLIDKSTMTKLKEKVTVFTGLVVTAQKLGDGPNK
jgi:hypothetical protein